MRLTTPITIQFNDAIDTISEQDWQTLSHSNNPFVDYHFFKALETSQSVSINQGWQAHHLVAKSQEQPVAVMPMYLKSHSWGEYVFDWDWADAFERYDLDYYPKLVSTIPFTPVESNKVLSSTLQVSDLFSTLIEYCEQQHINSWHILFTEQIKTPLPEDVYQRNTVQFHWFNRGYQDINDFFATFTSRKRRATRKERLSIAQQGLTIRHLNGHQITEKEIAFFYLTYQITYLKRGHQPHLNIDFFKQIISSMPDNILLIIASDQDEDVACALFFHDDSQLYGRYWGATGYYNNLHFELCYYQGIEFCINHNLSRFNPGTQGEHKIQRGFEPVLTYSYHWIMHPGFKQAIKDFCQQERSHMLTYQAQCRALLPFKKADK
ncbi:GNAT family N-acetyltransferase [Psychromonas sp. B3M02]|uniref:GNAT family N-acetyltransferase n=1 Tax=Psychromonas sp. B3M02 TaxID=2267226 RepID=UPI00215D8E88|nr:GNAT family N-acetyltransferase [Psychromonas sp. B3M02]